MHATLNGRDIDLAEISLDTFGWDSHVTRGPLSLVLGLDDNDLLTVGQKIFLYTQECLAVEFDFFTDEYMHDVPVPTSTRVFVEEPELIGIYLDNSFWSREIIVAILGMIPTTSKHSSPRYLIQNFRRVIVDEMMISVECGAVQPG